MGNTLNEKDANYYLNAENFANLRSDLIAFSPNAGLSSSDVQAALEELATGKVSPSFVTSSIAAAIAALVNSSPLVLDTLGEIAAALGNDPNFATTITTLLSQKQTQDALLDQIAALTDPGADRILFWDASANSFVWLIVGSNLSITGTTINATGGGGGGNVATDPIFDAKGDLAVGTGSDTAQKLTVGANNTIPIADSAETVGIRWITPAAYKTILALVKADVGLANVDNTSDVNKPVSTAQAAADSATLSSAQTYADGKVIDSIADSDATHAPSRNAVFDALAAKADLVGGFVPAGQLPGFVDDVLEAANFAALPGTGEAGKIYITLDDNKTYRWSGSVYTIISDTIALGETSATAYRGDRGKTAYDHSQATGNPHGATPADIAGFDEAAQDAVGSILDASVFTYSDIANVIGILYTKSITENGAGLELVNDTAAPGVNKLYGTDGAGAKGWFNQPIGGSGLSAGKVAARIAVRI